MGTPTFDVGDRIAYSADFCRSIGAFTGDVPFMRGIVTEVQPLGEKQLVHFTDQDGDARKAIADNLAHVGVNTRFSRC